MAHPAYQSKGAIKLNNEDIIDLDAQRRAEKEFFYRFKIPIVVWNYGFPTAQRSVKKIDPVTLRRKFKHSKRVAPI